MSDDNMPTHYLNPGAHNYTRYPLTPFISILKFTQNITWCPSTSLQYISTAIYCHSTAMPLSNHPIIQYPPGHSWRPSSTAQLAQNLLVPLAPGTSVPKGGRCRGNAGSGKWAASGGSKEMGCNKDPGKWRRIMGIHRWFSNVITCYNQS